MKEFDNFDKSDPESPVDGRRRAHDTFRASEAEVELVREEDAHIGARKVEAAQKVYGKWSKWYLYLGLALASYVYSLDGSTTYYYLAFATSTFNEHSLLSAVQVAQGIIIAVGKPVIAKVADVSSRANAYILVLTCYVLGYIIIASANSVSAIAGGIVIYAVGYTGLQLLTQIIIADITTLKWRGLVSSLTSAPFIVNAFVGANIASAILARSGWRWGYGMFAILVPAALSPLIVTLLWAERRASKLGMVTPRKSASDLRAVAPHPLKSRNWTSQISNWVNQLDILGLLFLGGGVSCILLPLTLAKDASKGWRNPSMIAMLVVGFVLLIVFIGYEIRFAVRPVIAPRFWKNRAIVGASIIGFFDFVSFYLTFTYLYSFIIVSQDWSLVNDIYFSSTQTVALTVFGILCGVLMRTFHRYKYILVTGLVIRLAGVGMMIHSRGANGSTVELVWTQILQGLGGGFAAVASQVGAQASVPHGDVAMTTALVLLLTEIGGSVGSAIAGAIWTNTMPKQLDIHLPFVNATTRADIFGSITDAAQYPRGNPIREGTIAAYSETMKLMLIAATCFSIVPIIVSILLMPNYYLGDKQNAVDQADLTGERRVEDVIGESDDDDERHELERGR